MDATVLCFLFQHGNVDPTLADNGAGSVTEQKATPTTNPNLTS